MNKKYVFWDWNGTLLDDANVVLSCINVSLGRFSCAPLTMRAFQNIQVDSLRDFYHAVGVPENKLDDALERERDIFHDHYEPKADSVPLRDGAARLLNRLSSNEVSSVILSNHIVDPIERLLKRHDIRKHFDDVLAFANRAAQFREIDKGKRLRRYLNDNKVSYSQAIIIGDTTEEIGIGRDMGLVSIAITGGLASEEQLCAAKPDHLVHSLDEMEDVFEERGFVNATL